MPQLPKLLTRDEVCEMLSIAPRTLSTLQAAGEIEFVRIGRAVRFEPQAVEAYIARQREPLRRSA